MKSEAVKVEHTVFQLVTRDKKISMKKTKRYENKNASKIESIQSEQTSIQRYAKYEYIMKAGDKT